MERIQLEVFPGGGILMIWRTTAIMKKNVGGPHGEVVEYPHVIKVLKVHCLPGDESHS